MNSIAVLQNYKHGVSKYLNSVVVLSPIIVKIKSENSNKGKIICRRYFLLQRIIFITTKQNAEQAKHHSSDICPTTQKETQDLQ